MRVREATEQAAENVVDTSNNDAVDKTDKEVANDSAMQAVKAASKLSAKGTATKAANETGMDD